MNEKLAIFDVNAKQSPAAQADWPRTKLLLAVADIVEELFAQQKRDGFYPRDFSREEFETQIHTDPKTRSALESPYTVIRREDGRLIPVPYNVAFRDLVMKVSGLLSAAAAVEPQPHFR